MKRNIMKILKYLFRKKTDKSNLENMEIEDMTLDQITELRSEYIKEFLDLIDDFIIRHPKVSTIEFFKNSKSWCIHREDLFSRHGLYNIRLQDNRGKII